MTKSKVTENDLQEILRYVLMADETNEPFQQAMEEQLADGRDDEAPLVDGCRTFAEAGILSNNKGLIIQLSDGSEFQLTIVRSY